ncbi:MAG: hypothetical protein HQK70_01410 [Desulfamplus sp.]|nr:hypothetical protein [Desulfamplus sp.]
MNRENCLITENFERKDYHLSVIRETAAQLSCVRHPKQILESFLMSAQGGVGALGGFALLTGENNIGGSTLLCRGIDTIQDQYINDLINQVSDCIINKSDSSPFFIQNSTFILLLACPIEDGRLVLMGLTQAMHGKEYDSDDRQLLMSIASLFQISLNSALFSTRVELLNAQLQKQNIDLDRQVFHLNALRELSLEAGQALNVESVLSAFLPTLLGRFSRYQGIVAVYNRETGAIYLKSMGIEPEPVINDSSQVDRMLFLTLAGVQNKHIQPLQVEPLIQMEQISSIIQGFVPESGFLFLVKEQMYGALLLGSPLEDRKLSEQEQELLFASVAQSVLHIKNADSFDTIVNLNRDLAKQNEALRQTIDELTNAQKRISALEAAAKRIAHIITRKADRLMHVRPLDFVLIIGISIIIGLIFNLQSPKGIPIMPIPRPDLVKSISVEAAKKMIETESISPLLIDARPREFYDISHAKGAINVPPYLFDSIYPISFANEDAERPLIIYGRSFSRLYDEDVARKFFNYDHEKIYLVEDNFERISTLKTDNKKTSEEIK